LDQKLLYDVLRAEIRDRKVPLSLGKTCPMKCTFCYEQDHSYRKTFNTPRTTQAHWQFILNEIQKCPSGKNEAWILGGNEYMEWTETFLHLCHGLAGGISRQHGQKDCDFYHWLSPA
jgi:sulfatase maturation enzyme AslB (radical SAM superfamily)